MIKPVAALASPIIAPTLDEWRAMSVPEREQLLEQINEALSLPRSASSRQASARLAQSLAVARAGIFAVLDARGIGCPEGLRTRISACDDPAILQRWLLRATTANDGAEIADG